MPGLLNLIAIIVIFGVLMWLINAFIPMPGAIKSLLNIVVLIVLIIYVLQFFALIKPILPMLNIFR
ncbi:Thivi_2564 family membrane protein [Legionella sp. CNM-4043-24]|uniref:Thivi_2564 family membrane protein n=1 Tax=Legionella sp. CNM-4043-24 TaxID=3421646 RepID=UPI00403AE79B